MKGSLREVYEIVVEGGPVAVLDVFVKKSTSGISTATHVVERIKNRLARVKEIEREEEVS
jgi:phage-related protein